MDNTVLVNDGFYHIFNKSIAGFKIFNYDCEFLRVLQAIIYYQLENPPGRFARYIEKEHKGTFQVFFNEKFSNKAKIVNIVAYCLMPTHIHLILKQLVDDGIITFVGNILNSYSHYFNIKYKRKGPLWESRFKKVLVESDSQLLHLTSYVHLNPETAYLVNKPEDWLFSSYREYAFPMPEQERVCKFEDVLDIKPEFYRKFVESNIDNQRNLANIKNLIVDHSVAS